VQEVSSGGDASVLVVVSDVVLLVVFDISGFTVFGMPHIFHSVILTGLRFYSGLLGSHIAAFCSGVNDDDVDVLPSSDPGLLQSVQILLKQLLLL
jgi:hypothetical protein